MKIKSFKSNIKFFGFELISTILIVVFMSVASFYLINQSVSTVEKLQTACEKQGGQLVEHNDMNLVGNHLISILSYSCKKQRPF